MGQVNSATTPWATTLAITEPEARLAMSASWAKAPSSSILSETGIPEGAAPAASVSGNTINVTAHHLIHEDASGTWVCTSAATLGCPLDTPLPSSGQSRFDLVVGEVVAGVYRLRSITGTASASPSVPAVPANTTPLFRVPVTNAGPQTPVAIFGYTRAPGGIRLVSSLADTRAGSFTGDLRRTMTGVIQRWTGTAWETIASPAAWTEFTPTLYTQQGAQAMGSGGSAIGRYLVQGKVCHLRYVFRRGTSFVGGWGDVTTRLPPGITSAPSEETQILAKLNANDAGNTLHAIFLGKCFIPPNSQMMNLYFPVDYTRSDLHTYQMSDSSAGNPGTGFPRIPGSYATPGILVIQGTIEIA